MAKSKKKDDKKPVARKATKCPVTRQEFTDKAEPVKVTIAGQDQVLESRTFSTGSLGWYTSGKLVITVNGKPVKVQAAVSLIAVGSKDLPQ